MKKLAFALVGFCLLFLGVVWKFTHVSQREFDDAKWRSFNGECSNEKYAMVYDLIQSRRLVSLNKQQVIELLGAEIAHELPGGRIEYCAGRDSKFSLNRPYHLVISFQKDKADGLTVSFVNLEGPP